LPDDARGAAAVYLAHDAVPVPNWFQTKKPALEEWEKLRPCAEDLDRLFPPRQKRNVGLLLGAPSSGLLDTDLDCAEAVAAAAELLPVTGWISGREGSPRSHWWYRVVNPPAKAFEAYTDLGAEKLVELRSTGSQTVVPPSIWKDDPADPARTEQVVWHEFTHPADVDFVELIVAVRSVAAAALLARHWPDKGSRHDARLALSGGLTRAGWSEERVTKFVRAVTIAAGNRGVRDAGAVAGSTADRIAEDKKTWGWPKLEELLGVNGKAVCGKVREWLGIPAPRRPTGNPCASSSRTGLSRSAHSRRRWPPTSGKGRRPSAATRRTWPCRSSPWSCRPSATPVPYASNAAGRSPPSPGPSSSGTRALSSPRPT
jgi:hypothetical protein